MSNDIERVHDRPTQNCWWCTLLAGLLVITLAAGMGYGILFAVGETIEHFVP